MIPWPWMCALSSPTDLTSLRVAILVDDDAAGLAGEVALAGFLNWLDALLTDEFAEAGPLTVRLQMDAGIADLNQRFRDTPGATDVLSFAGEATGPEPHLGDVAISLEAAARQAAGERHSLDEEVRLLALHGVLHCLGYDHETDDGEMLVTELALRRRWLREEEGD